MTVRKVPCTVTGSRSGASLIGTQPERSVVARSSTASACDWLAHWRRPARRRPLECGMWSSLIGRRCFTLLAADGRRLRRHPAARAPPPVASPRCRGGRPRCATPARTVLAYSGSCAGGPARVARRNHRGPVWPITRDGWMSDSPFGPRDRNLAEQLGAEASPAARSRCRPERVVSAAISRRASSQRSPPRDEANARISSTPSLGDEQHRHDRAALLVDLQPQVEARRRRSRAGCRDRCTTTPGRPRRRRTDPGAPGPTRRDSRPTPRGAHRAPRRTTRGVLATASSSEPSCRSVSARTP